MLQGEIKAMARRDGGAIEASLSWHVNGSLTEGRKAIREYSKLMLRAYNAEADNLVRSLKPYKLQSALDRLDKVAFTIERLGMRFTLTLTSAIAGNFLAAGGSDPVASARWLILGIAALTVIGTATAFPVTTGRRNQA